MADAPDRVERVLDLLMTLLETSRPLSREDIFEKFKAIGAYPESPEAARRAFERDKETLRALGVPIHSQPVGDGSVTGYRVRPDDYYLPDLGLDEAETAALRVALNAVSLGADAGVDALLKLGTSATGSPVPLAALAAAPALPDVFEAQRRRCVVTFTYRGAVRRLEPYGLAVRRGCWYVVGRDVDRDAIRSFRADRMGEEVTVGPPGAFTPPADFAPGEHIEDRAWMFGDDPIVSVRIRIDAATVPLVLGELGEDVAVIAEESDGAVEVEVAASAPAALRTSLLGFRDSVEVLGPPEQRAAMIETLRSFGEPA